MHERSAGPRRHWDIFCRLVDNFGDIGVCWRLARDLSEHHPVSVRLWIDRPEAFFMLQPGLRGQTLPLALGHIEVREWCEPFAPADAAEVVIEAFACELPAAYLEAMAARPCRPVWVDLDYLSAEAWVGDFHGLGSAHPGSGLQRHFFFPGFEHNTGGLLREPGLFAQRDPCSRSATTFVIANRRAVSFWPRSGSRPARTKPCWCRCSATRTRRFPSSWRCGQTVTVRCCCWCRRGGHWVASRRFWASPICRSANTTAVAGCGYRCCRFPTRPATTGCCGCALLWMCDLNFVRGEDSFVRAQWAARPCVWHIYRQDAGVHLVKLDAFLARYCEGLDEADARALCAFWRQWNLFWRQWNLERSLAEAWPRLAAALSALQRHAQRWSDALARQTDLASQLVQFCEKRL